jgi:RHS repeat-associated protein
VAEYEYDAWGNILSQTGSLASENPYRYAGYRYDEVTGLYYLMARYYDTNIGRFITVDMIFRYQALVDDDVGTWIAKELDKCDRKPRNGWIDI